MVDGATIGVLSCGFYKQNLPSNHQQPFCKREDSVCVALQSFQIHKTPTNIAE